MKFKIIPGRFAICQLPAGSAVPAWATATPGAFASVTATLEELSIVCEESAAPEGIKSQKGFVCLQLEGPFPLDSVGILREFLEPLSAAGVPIFAISTFNTDFVLVPEAKKALALNALQQAGHDLLT
ncbi:MAG: ACT domain-containing protein [Acidobacteriia bacterium]|nr:ACT domain-containing protein [Terriglobia bacterium]